MTTTAIKERPILFSAPMINALLEGRKTQTRRIVKPSKKFLAQVDDMESSWLDGYSHMSATQEGFVVMHGEGDYLIECPYGGVGDRLWVKERHRFLGWDADGEYYTVEYSDGARIVCEYGGEDGEEFLERMDRVGRKYGTTEEGQHILDLSRLPQRPSIFMPRWASRITLEITDVRVQHVEEISEDDAKAEGLRQNNLGQWLPHYASAAGWTDARAAFLGLFYDINKRAPRGENPWVWALTFKVVT